MLTLAIVIGGTFMSLDIILGIMILKDRHSRSI